MYIQGWWFLFSRGETSVRNLEAAYKAKSAQHNVLKIVTDSSCVFINSCWKCASRSWVSWLLFFTTRPNSFPGRLSQIIIIFDTPPMLSLITVPVHIDKISCYLTDWKLLRYTAVINPIIFRVKPQKFNAMIPRSAWYWNNSPFKWSITGSSTNGNINTVYKR